MTSRFDYVAGQVCIVEAEVAAEHTILQHLHGEICVLRAHYDSVLFKVEVLSMSLFEKRERLLKLTDNQNDSSSSTQSLLALEAEIAAEERVWDTWDAALIKVQDCMDAKMLEGITIETSLQEKVKALRQIHGKFCPSTSFWIPSTHPMLTTLGWDESKDWGFHGDGRDYAKPIVFDVREWRPFWNLTEPALEVGLL